ncbi:MAG: hypothetical protein CMJ18_22630 [Phycisphaeraceae bacterium]|nr:hypothetical protein [Phycisphaeraceae bacterium]
MRLLRHEPDARIPFREALLSRAMVLGADAAGDAQYLLWLGYDHLSQRGLTGRLAFTRHVGGPDEPTLLSRPVFVEACGPEMTRWAYAADRFGYPHGFVSIGPEWTVWIHTSETEYGVRLFTQKEQIGQVSTPDDVVGPVNLAVADLGGDGIPDLIGGCFCGYPDGYWPPVGDRTDNAPWSEIVKSRFDENGKWRGGSERGFLYRFRNVGTAQAPRFEGHGAPLVDPEGLPIEFFGVATACPVDLDGDGDVDLICGQCNGNLIYLENIGEPGAPQFVDRGPVRRPDRTPWELVTRQSQPAAVNRDPAGRTIILLSGIHFGCVPVIGMGDDGVPILGPEETFLTAGGDVHGPTFSVPAAVDWDGDGDIDLIVGAESGAVEFIENTGGPQSPRFAAPVPLLAGGKPIRITPGPEGDVQGPQESSWGYTNPAVGDWTGDGTDDLILGTSLGRMILYRNTGRDRNGMPMLAEGVWLRQGDGTFDTVWRQRPCIADIDADGRTELIALDPQGRLAVYRKIDSADPALLDEGTLLLDPDDQPYKLDGHQNRGSVLAGRTKLWMSDVTGTGTLDVLFGTILGKVEPVPDGRVPTVRWIANIGTPTVPRFGRARDVTFNGGPLALGRHTPTPCMVDIDGDGEPEMLIGIDCGALLLFEPSELRFEGIPGSAS